MLQRKCSCGGNSSSGGECEACKKKALQRRVAGSGETATAPADCVHEVLRSPGQPLDAATRSFFEPRFGHDFSKVRVHADAKAAESARAVNALAYTAGRDVVFGQGQYFPATLTGQKLMAHELAHVVQQDFRDARGDQTTEVGNAADQYERAADQVASAVTDSSTAMPAPAAAPTSAVLPVQRQGPVIQRQALNCYEDAVRPRNAPTQPRNATP